MEKIFTQIYENKVWGDNGNLEYSGSSGGGSEIDYNKDTYVVLLRKIIMNNNIKNIVDLGCGDFKCGKLIYDDLDITYTGYDAYNKIIEYNSKHHSSTKYTFIHLDFSKEIKNLVSGDMCILKDVLQHWSTDNIYKFLDELVESKKFKYILICNCCHQRKDNIDIQDGQTRPLSSNYFPLKKYNPKILYYYNTKEVSVIKI